MSNPPAPTHLSAHNRRPSHARVGLVLGGGGAVGAAYHAGALAALEQDLGWDARNAAVIVGTSAGSLVGALLRSGVPATDLAALTVGADALDTSPELVTSLLDRPAFPPITIGSFLRTPRLPSPMMMFGLAKLTARRRSFPFGALSMMLPEGREVLAPHLAFIDGELSRAHGRGPPTRSSSAPCAGGTGAASCSGRVRNTPPLSLALAASCAVPGYFAGVDIDGEVFLDGGAISATNADVLAAPRPRSRGHRLADDRKRPTTVTVAVRAQPVPAEPRPRGAEVGATRNPDGRRRTRRRRAGAHVDGLHERRGLGRHRAERVPRHRRADSSVSGAAVVAHQAQWHA